MFDHGCEACDTGGKCRPERKPALVQYCAKCRAVLHRETPARCPECGEPTERKDGDA